MKIKKNGSFYSVIIVLSFMTFLPAWAKVEVTIGLPIEQNPNLFLKAPSTDASEIILSREQYIISYNKFRRSPNWVAWKLAANLMGKSGRSNQFSVDQDLNNYLSQTMNSKGAVTSTEYRGSCYDRGHQVPSADRTDSLSNNETTFLMSNMIPQTAYLNRIIWEHLERHSRNLVQKQEKKLYILSGPIYDQDFGHIGPQKDIPIPSKNFKIIYVLDSKNKIIETLAVIMPNTLRDGTMAIKDAEGNCPGLQVSDTDSQDWEKYKTSIQEIEKISGLSFASPTSDARESSHTSAL